MSRGRRRLDDRGRALWFWGQNICPADTDVIEGMIKILVRMRSPHHWRGQWAMRCWMDGIKEKEKTAIKIINQAIGKRT